VLNGVFDALGKTRSTGSNPSQKRSCLSVIHEVAASISDSAYYQTMLATCLWFARVLFRLPADPEAVVLRLVQSGRILHVVNDLSLVHDLH